MHEYFCPPEVLVSLNLEELNCEVCGETIAVFLSSDSQIKKKAVCAACYNSSMGIEKIKE